MAKILITSGPTRQYLDPVRYLTNSSSGKMGVALCEAALDLGHEVIVVTGPVGVDYPCAARRIDVVTTSEMLKASREIFADCDGLIGAAAPCDYRPVRVADQKIAKTGAPLMLELWETEDIVATLGAEKRDDQWTVGFALETEDPRFRAITKLERKSCDLIVLNGTEAMNSDTNSVEILGPGGELFGSSQGTKPTVAQAILDVIQSHLIASFHKNDKL